MKTEAENAINPEKSSNPTRPKSREVSSRFLSPLSGSEKPELPSLKTSISPTRNKSIKSITLSDKKNHKSLWPSTSSSKSNSLADHIGNDRLDDLILHKKNNKTDKLMSLNRQRSCNELSRFESNKNDNDKDLSKISRENHKDKAFFGGSMRYTGKFLSFSKKSSAKTSSYDDSISSYDSPCNSSEDVIPRRMSVHGHSSKKIGTADSVGSRSFDHSPKKKTFSSLKRTNSMYGTITSKWALSPGRSGSPPMTVENKGVPPISFSSSSFSSSSRPPSSPSKEKGVGNLLSKGLSLLKGKRDKNGLYASSPLGLTTGPATTTESVHQLRMMHNRLVQWRHANARADDVNMNITNQAESNLIAAWDALTKLQHSVKQKKIQLEKEKLQMKLHFVLRSQINLLKAWGELERQHLSVVSNTKDCLYSVICKVPLVEGAKMDPHSSSFALRHASDLATSIKSMLNSISPMVENTTSIFSELAEVVAQERALLEEFLELCKYVSTLEVEEMSLKCRLIQMKMQSQQVQIVA